MRHLLVTKLIDGTWHLSSLCGAEPVPGEGITRVTDPRHVDCEECLRRMEEKS